MDFIITPYALYCIIIRLFAWFIYGCSSIVSPLGEITPHIRSGQLQVQAMIKWAAACGDLNVVTEICRNADIPSDQLEDTLKFLASFGNKDAIKAVLFKRAISFDQLEAMIKWASIFLHIDVVHYLRRKYQDLRRKYQDNQGITTQGAKSEPGSVSNASFSDKKQAHNVTANKCFDHKSTKKTYTSVKRFSCGTCGKPFPHNSGLKVHLRIHKQEKPYLCPICLKSFTQIGNFNTHIRTHTKEQPFACLMCDKKYMHKISLRNHSIKVHLEQFQ